MQAAREATRCKGWYWIDGDPGHWERVNGTVKGVSRKVFTERGGIAYLYSKVRIKTSNGVKTAYILQASKKCLVTQGGVARESATVGRLPKFRGGRLNGMYSKKVLVT